jgi:dTDP-4-dehydrorhamnose 3,5-epimerase
MEFVEELLPGVRQVRLKRFVDGRGDFVKTYDRSVYFAAGVAFDFAEEFYSVSMKNVVRGMHFQRPPHDHDKIVYCAAGAVEDVLLDLRKGDGYGRFRSVVLSADDPLLLFIPKGVAHGFKSLADDSLMIYKTSTEYAPQHDCGICWNSFGYDWQCKAPIISKRDQQHPRFSEFQSPFWL